jgi:hypothetical protein
MWLYIALHRDRLGASALVRSPRAATVRFTAGLAGYVVTTLLAAFVSAGIALALYGVIAVYYLFDHLPDASGAGPGPAAGEGSAGAETDSF